MRLTSITMKVSLVLTVLMLLGCAAVSNMETVSAASLVAPDVSGTWSGHLTHQPEFPAIDFDISISISQSGSGDYQILTGTVTRSATQCWDATPIPVKGAIRVSDDGHGNIVRRVTLEQVGVINVTLQGFPDASLHHASFAYGSILPDSHPCQAVQAIGDLSR